MIELLMAALIGGAISAMGVTAYSQWRKNARLRNLQSAAKHVAAAQVTDSIEAAKEAEKRAVDEKYAIQALQDAVSKL